MDADDPRLLHLAAKLLGLRHFLHILPYAGQSSFLWYSCLQPQFQHSRVCFDSWEGIGGFDSLPEASALTVTAWLSSTSFICDTMLSTAWQISSVRCRVSHDSRSKRSLVFASRIPNTSRSRSISSGMILSKSQPSASLRSAVQYWS